MISHSPSQSISIRNASKSVWTLLDQAMASVATTAWDTRTALSSWATSPGLGHSCRAFTPCVAPCSKKKRYNLEIEWDTKIIWIHLIHLDSWIILSHSIRLAWEMHTTRHLWAVTCFILLHLAASCLVLRPNDVVESLHTGLAGLQSGVEAIQLKDSMSMTPTDPTWSYRRTILTVAHRRIASRFSMFLHELSPVLIAFQLCSIA